MVATHRIKSPIVYSILERINKWSEKCSNNALMVWLFRLYALQRYIVHLITLFEVASFHRRGLDEMPPCLVRTHQIIKSHLPSP